MSSRERKQLAGVTKKSAARRQAAALPYRINSDGELEILVLTSRQTRRFVVPKGWLKKGLSESATAAEEAFEEAGVKGQVGKKPLGTYSYWKRQNRLFDRIKVHVYALKVTEQDAQWPEKKERDRAWLPVEDAATLIDEQELATLVRTLEVDARGKLSSHAPPPH